MKIDYKKDRRRRVSFEKRDQYGISAKEMIDVKCLAKSMETTALLIKKLRTNKERNKKKLGKLYRVVDAIHESMSELLRIEVNDEKTPKQKFPSKTFFDFDREGFSSKFRFYTPEDLQRFTRGFGFREVVHLQRYKSM
jgi:hypothetical protein